MECEGRIAQERELEFVGRAVETCGDKLVFGQPLGLADGDRLPVAQREHMTQIVLVDILVVISLHGARGTVKSHRATLGIEHSRLADGGCETVERHHIARCGNP